MKNIKRRILKALENKPNLTEEEIDEKLCEYSDRQIVVSVLNLLTLKQLNKLIKTLKENFG